jgi:hypothetical protein
MRGAPSAATRSPRCSQVATAPAGSKCATAGRPGPSAKFVAEKVKAAMDRHFREPPHTAPAQCVQVGFAEFTAPRARHDATCPARTDGAARRLPPPGACPTRHDQAPDGRPGPLMQPALLDTLCVDLLDTLLVTVPTAPARSRMQSQVFRSPGCCAASGAVAQPHPATSSCGVDWRRASNR